MHPDVKLFVSQLVIGCEYDVTEYGGTSFTATLVGLWLEDVCRQNGGCYVMFDRFKDKGRIDGLWSRQIAEIAQRKAKPSRRKDGEKDE